MSHLEPQARWVGRPLKYAYQRRTYFDIKGAISKSHEILGCGTSALEATEAELTCEAIRWIDQALPLLQKAREQALLLDQELRIREHIRLGTFR